jgi:hypothetical protein
LGSWRRPRGPARWPGVDEFDAEVATAWFDQALALVKGTPGFSPPVASRAFGCTGVTLYEALAPGMDGFRPLGNVLPDLSPVPAVGKNYDWRTVANAALASILRGLFPLSQAGVINALEQRFEDRFRPALAQGVFRRSVERGRDVADAIFEWSKTDGGHEGYLNNFPQYEPPRGPGLWEPTPPGLLPALQPYWSRNRCLAIEEGAACPPPPFPEYPSGHSVQSGAAFEVLADLFGRSYAFTDRTHDDRGFAPRSFDSFSQAAEEAALSRLYGGIHYRSAIDNGVLQGICIGQAANVLPLRV